MVSKARDNDPMTFLGLLKSDTGAQNYGDYRNPNESGDTAATTADGADASQARTTAVRHFMTFPPKGLLYKD